MWLVELDCFRIRSKTCRQFSRFYDEKKNRREKTPIIISKTKNVYLLLTKWFQPSLFHKKFYHYFKQIKKIFSWEISSCWIYTKKTVFFPFGWMCKLNAIHCDKMFPFEQFISFDCRIRPKKFIEHFNMKSPNFLFIKENCVREGERNIFVTPEQIVCSSYFLFEFNFWCRTIAHKKLLCSSYTKETFMYPVLTAMRVEYEKVRIQFPKLYIQSQFITYAQMRRKKNVTMIDAITVNVHSLFSYKRNIPCICEFSSLDLYASKVDIGKQSHVHNHMPVSCAVQNVSVLIFHSLDVIYVQ